MRSFIGVVVCGRSSFRVALWVMFYTLLYYLGGVVFPLSV